MRKFYERHKNKILKIQAIINVLLFIISACSLDSESNTPGIVCGATLSWLLLFAYANDWFTPEDTAVEKDSYTRKPAEIHKIDTKRKKVI